MKVLIALFAALAVAQGHNSNAVRVRFDVNLLHYGSKSFFKIPKTYDEAVAEGWTLEKRPDNSYLPLLNLYCYSDKIVCILLDDTGYFAGMQVAMRKDSFKNCYKFDNPAIMASRGYKNWTSTVDGTPYDFYTICFFTIDQAALETSAAKRINARRKNNRILQNSIWLEGTGGIRKVSTKLKDIKNDGTFTEQAFIPCMGVHRYSNMSESAKCTSDNLYPWFLLTHDGKMVALGLMNFGKYKHDSKERFWFEEPSEFIVKTIVPRGPKCLYELVDKCGVITMHTFFLDNPCRSIILNY